MLERINLILKSRNLNAAQFADEIGVQRSSVSHILTGRNNASLDFLLKVLNRYPEIDTDWLLTGKGIMMRRTASGSNTYPEIKPEEPTSSTSVFPTNKVPDDLFAQIMDIQDINISKPRVVDNDPVEVSEEKSPLTQKDKQQQKPDERVRITDSARQIEKIVIFYSDKTFEYYKPEN